MYEKIIIFKTKLVVLENILPKCRLKDGTTLRGECVGGLPETVMVLIRNDLLDCLPTPFSEKSSYEIPFATMFVFQKIHVMHSHLISRLPSAYKMHYVISIIYTIYQIYQYATFSNLHSQHMSFNNDQSSLKLAHLSNLQYHLQWPTHTIIFHIIMSLC